MTDIVVRKIAFGEKISEPGFYEMPINFYHSDCCVGPSISSTGLRAIDLDSLEDYWGTSYLNPDRPKEGEPGWEDPEFEAEHFRIGRATHWRLLEPQRFAQSIAVRPPMWDSWRKDAAKEWRGDAQREGFTVLTLDELGRVDGMAKAMRAHPIWDQGLLRGGVELSMIVQDAKTGIWLKSRPDAIPVAEALTDLKIMADNSPDTAARSIKRLGYDMQMALGGICFEKLTGQFIEQFYIVTVRHKYPHIIHVPVLNDAAIYWARIRIRKALDRMAEALQTGYWPGYEQDGMAVGPSLREMEDLVQQQKNALLPADNEF